MGRAKGVDHFSSVLGGRRGLGPNRRSIITDATRIASEELHRLMDLASQGLFEEPLYVLQACKDKLNQRPASSADVLCMTVATQMVKVTGDNLLQITKTFYPSDTAEAAAAGIRSRMGEFLEPILVECPPDNWEEWLDERWQNDFSKVLAKWFSIRPENSCAIVLENAPHLKLDSKETRSLLAVADKVDWLEIADYIIEADVKGNPETQRIAQRDFASKLYGILYPLAHPAN